MRIAQVIKYEGDNSTFVWKHECEDFNTMSQLIVHESQEAILFKNGQALDLFSAGRHTLSTQNIPILGKLINKLTDDETPFHCEVYFINLVEQMSLKWGTDSKIQYIEPTYKCPFLIGASGEMSVSVADSRKLLLKLVGTENSLSQSSMANMFRAFLMTRIKSYIATILTTSKISIFELDMYLEQFSSQLIEKLKPDFQEYGLKLNQFFVTTISRPEGEVQYETIKELHFRQYADIADATIRQQKELIEQQTRSAKMKMEAEALADKRRVEGYDYQTERAYDTAEKLVSNEGIGNFSNAGIGLGMMGGMGIGIGRGVSGIVDNALTPINSPTQVQTAPAISHMGETVNGMPPIIALKEQVNSENVLKNKTENSMGNFEERVEKLKMMRDNGLINDEIFDEHVKKLLSEV